MLVLINLVFGRMILFIYMENLSCKIHDFVENIYFRQILLVLIYISYASGNSLYLLLTVFIYVFLFCRLTILHHLSLICQLSMTFSFIYFHAFLSLLIIVTMSWDDKTLSKLIFFSARRIFIR